MKDSNDSNGASPHLLIVDSDANSALDLQRSLEGLGYAVVGAAASGEEAYSLSTVVSPDLVLLDINLKGFVDGIEAARHIRQHHNVPVVYVTGEAGAEALQRAKRTEPFGFVTKPYSVAQLHATVEMALYKDKLERRSKAGKKWLQLTLDAVSDAVVTVDYKGLIRFLNLPAALLAGRELKEALNQELTQVFNLVDRKTGKPFACGLMRSAQGDEWREHLASTVLRCADGTEVAVDEATSPIRDSKGNIIGAVWVFRKSKVEVSRPSRASAPLKMEEISSYFLDLERLLDGVENATTHYQVLGVKPSAAGNVIEAAYKQNRRALNPSGRKITKALPNQTLDRIHAAAEKNSLAFAILSDPAKRREYDDSLRRANVDTPAPNSTPVASTEDEQSGKEKQDDLIIAFRPPQAAGSSLSRPKENRRRFERLKLSLPVHVTGYARAGEKWTEMAQTADVSKQGVAVRLRQRVRTGAVLYLTLPMPLKLRNHGYSEPGYKVYALVRHVEPAQNGVRVAGLEFLGEHPPKGLLDKPWATFRTEKWSGPERRREPREDRAEAVEIEYLNDVMEIVGREKAVTENISRGGMRVCVKKPPADFEMIRVRNQKLDFESFAILRDQFTGVDGGERLCLQLVNQEYPL